MSKIDSINSSNRGGETIGATHRYAGIAANGRIKAKATIGSYAEAAAFLLINDANAAKVAANTTVVRNDGPVDLGGGISVILYSTPIITYYAEGTFVAWNGGWNTPTTSARMNQFGPRGWFFFHDRKRLAARCSACRDTFRGRPEDGGRIRATIDCNGERVR